MSTPSPSELTERIVGELSAWLEGDYAFRARRPPRFIESSGVFMKDTAVPAGLGAIGRSNLVITPEYGPRIRWRVLLLDHAAEATGPVDCDPREGCDVPCRRACPVGAFDETACDASALGQTELPATDGTYDRITCNTRMAQEVEDASAVLAASEDDRRQVADTMNAFEEVDMALPVVDGEARYGVRHCRRCELSCSVGR